MAKDRFVIDTSSNAKAKISFLGDNFKAWFLGKVEEPFARRKRQIYPTLFRVYIFRLIESDLFGAPPTKSAKEIMAEFKKTDRYGIKFFK